MSDYMHIHVGELDADKGEFDELTPQELKQLYWELVKLEGDAANEYEAMGYWLGGADSHLERYELQARVAAAEAKLNTYSSILDRVSEAREGSDD